MSRLAHGVRHKYERQTTQKLKVTGMRTTTLHDGRPVNRIPIRRKTKLSVDFKPAQSSILPVHIVATREYLRDLRAAEMSAWESSGGDYLVSR